MFLVMKGCVIWLSGVVLKVDGSRALWSRGKKSYKKNVYFTEFWIVKINNISRLKLFKSDLILGM